MRICLLGEFSDKTDEGMKNISSNYKKFISKRHDVLALNQREIILPHNIAKFIRFNPQIIHYIHGPTIRSLVLTKLLSLLTSKAKVVVSATRPFFSKFTRQFIPVFRPDLVFTQSKKWELFFESYSCKIRFMPNGLIIKNFSSLPNNVTNEIKIKYGVSEGKFVVLHVGHIRNNRNLSLMADIQKKRNDIQCVIVGSTSTEPDKELSGLLKESGCIVIREYFENISDIYNIADCYIFTVRDKSNNELPKSYNEIGCIDIPMSVLEAMACNIPIVTTRYGAFPEMFKEDRGFYFADEEREVLMALDKIRNGNLVDNRNKVSEFDWPNLISKMESSFLELTQ